MNIKEWIIENLPTNSIVLEAGTYDGRDTEFFANYFVNGKIYGFEPVPELFFKTLSRVSEKSNVTVYNKALSEKTDTAQIYVSDRFGDLWGSSSLLPPKEHLTIHPEITFNKVIEIETINLDEWAETNSIDKIDFMWLDLQGYEPVVLSSSLTTLRKTKYLYTEISLIENYNNLIIWNDYQKFLNENGFEVILDEIYWTDGGNVLLANTNI